MKLHENLAVIIIICPFLFCTYSCKTSSKEDCPPSQVSKRLNSKASLFVMDTLRLPVDNETRAQAYFDQTTEIEGVPYYFAFDVQQGNIAGYDLTTQTKNFELDLSALHYFDASILEDFYFHNSDSIFLISAENIRKIYLINEHGELQKKWDIKLPESLRDYWLSVELLFNFNYNEKFKTVYFWLYPSGADYYNTEHYVNTRVGEYSLAGDSLRTWDGYPCEMYSNQKIYDSDAYINAYFFEDKMVTYFLPLNEIRITDLSTKLVSQFSVKSNFAPEIITPYGTAGKPIKDIEREKIYDTENPFYVKMVSNQDGTLHYRILKKGVPARYNDGRMRSFHDRPFSIMVLNENFDILKEVEFDGGTYDFFQCFAIDDKFYLSLNNNMNAYASEDFFQFAVFQFQ